MFLHPCVEAEVAGELATALDLMVVVAEAMDCVKTLHPLHGLERTVEDAVKSDPRILAEEARREVRDSRAPFY